MMIEKLERFLLISVSLGLSIIGLGYLIETNFYPEIYEFNPISISEKNIYRALGGLYLVFGLFWMISLAKKDLQKTSIISIILIMFGLILGRTISLIFDGFPHELLNFFLGLEIFVLIQAVFVYIKKYH